jgi:DNA-binding CsgD family transcriptional regulator
MYVRPSLTYRERDLVRGLLANKVNKEIAFDCGISHLSVKQYMSRLMRKCGVTCRAALADLYREPSYSSVAGEAVSFETFLRIAQTITLTADQARQILLQLVVTPNGLSTDS